MTTIVYDHKNGQIACDSRETANNEIKSDSVQKWHYEGADIYFTAGHTADLEALKQADKVRGEKPEHAIEMSGIKVSNGKVYKFAYCDEHGYWEVPLTFNDYLGSGGVYSSCALDFGKSALEAVEYAKTKDSCSGGKVWLLDLATMEIK